jgi:hypothetical protein
VVRTFRTAFGAIAPLLLATWTDPVRAAEPDPFVPGAGRVGMAVATGVPFLVMSEVSLGVTPYGAVGVLAGTTPIVSGFGVRPRLQAPITDRWRLLLTAPILFYPAHADAGAWWLARPSLSVDFAPIAPTHVAVGAGVVPVATHAALFGDEHGRGAASPYGFTTSNGDRKDLWWTINLSASQSISERSFAFLDATAIMSGLALAGDDWIAGPPCVVFLGLGTSL